MDMNKYSVETINANNKPSTLVSTIIVFATILIITIVLILASKMETQYNTTAEVYRIKPTETLFIDGAGYVWSAYDTNYRKGEFVQLYFDNNRTDYTRNDDKIIKIKRLDN